MNISVGKLKIEAAAHLAAAINNKKCRTISATEFHSRIPLKTLGFRSIDIKMYARIKE